MEQLGTCLDTAVTIDCAWISGHNDKVLLGKTWLDCKEACCEDSKCKSFDFAIVEGKCQIAYVSKIDKPDAFVSKPFCSLNPISYTEIGSIITLLF